MVVKNKLIPFPGYKMINICGIIFTRSNYISDIDLNHEKIHSRQIFEMLIIFYYIWYILEWLFRLIMYFDFDKAYKNLSFEKEAYKNQGNLNYLKKRGLFKWMSYMN